MRDQTEGLPPAGPATAARQRWMSLLARAAPAQLERLFANETGLPGYRLLRGPETGLVMVRGRTGGTGAPFNLGEATVTRCTIETSKGAVGHAYVLGRGFRHAEIAAVYDALLQYPEQRPGIEARVLAPISEALLADAARQAGETAATRVEFFTMVRGEA